VEFLIKRFKAGAFENGYKNTKNEKFEKLKFEFEFALKYGFDDFSVRLRRKIYIVRHCNISVQEVQPYPFFTSAKP